MPWGQARVGWGGLNSGLHDGPRWLMGVGGGPGQPTACPCETGPGWLGSWTEERGPAL